MDGYAPAFVAHNLPLLVVSGLVAHDEPELENDGIPIASEIPPVESDDARTLLRHFQNSDGGDLAWNGREHTGRNKFKVKTIGRVDKPAWQFNSVRVTEALIRILFSPRRMPYPPQHLYPPVPLPDPCFIPPYHRSVLDLRFSLMV